ncbi:MAG TPA: ATP-binding protein [Pyrinomonadaceae bacterium]|nr:ATP-binding protein [Pyrinomonadaceae bacterium]
MKAIGIAEAVLERRDMKLVTGDKSDLFVTVEEVEGLLESLPDENRCALVLVSRAGESDEALVKGWLAVRDDLVVMHVDVIDAVVRIGLRNPSFESLVNVLHQLVERKDAKPQDRVISLQLRSVKPPPPPPEDHSEPPPEPPRGTLLEASIKWVHALLRDAVGRVPVDGNDLNIFALTRAVLLESLDEPTEGGRDNVPESLAEAESALNDALATVEENDEPLAIAYRVFEVGPDVKPEVRPLAFRMMVLTLAPEFDLRFQRCFGFLLDDMGRRVGTLALIGSLLKIDPGVRAEMLRDGALTRWLVFDDPEARLPAADEPLRIDPFLAQWLLGDHLALGNDPRVRRVLRLERWPGASLLQRYEEKARAATLIEKLKRSNKNRWILLDEEDSAGWRALLELGARNHHIRLIRVEAKRLAGVDVLAIEECAARIGRMSRLTRYPVVIDVTETDNLENESLRIFLARLHRADCRTAVICRNEAHIVRLLGTTRFELIPDLALSIAARIAAVREAARKTGAYITDDSAEAIANRYPLPIDGLEHATLLASKRPKNYNAEDPQLDRLTSACRELASEGISHLVETIEPVFSLEEVVLPADRKQQLNEIVDNVRFASRVLDGWKFREQLPYGRGVTALFSGVSGTGKTMAAMGIARRLGIQILRLDLSRVVNKYIGETEKNIDRVFTDAQKSGAAVLIDEADALLGKRSEVKEAHDRYANIEVAYLLQRMEAYDGLAILTTNMRMNLDPAFVRRLRFIIDFPKPNVEAREQIWRQCLPEPSHDLKDADFRQLARRIDLTGGQIRQITLRAAFIAAAADSRITLEHIAQATRAELAKLGMPPVEIDLTQARRAA